MNSTFLIIKQTLIENFKSKKSLIYFGISMILFFIIMLNFTPANATSLLELVFSFNLTIYLWCLLVFSGLVYFIYLLFATISSLDNDLNGGVSLILFTRPISRFNYIFAKFVGLFIYFVLLQSIIGIFAKLIGSLYATNYAMIHNLNIILLAGMSTILSYSVLLIALAFLLFFIFKKPIISITTSIIITVFMWVYPPLIYFITYEHTFNLIAPLINSNLKILLNNKVYLSFWDMLTIYTNKLTVIGYTPNQTIFFNASINWFILLLIYVFVAVILVLISYILFKKQDIL